MDVGDVLSSHRFAVELDNIQVETVQAISGLTYGQEVIEVKQVTATGELVVRKQPGVSRAGEVTITRGMDTSRAFTDWIKETREYHNLDSARKNITITILDAQQTPVRRFHLQNAWVSEWTVTSDAASEGPALEQVTIAYEECTME